MYFEIGLRDFVVERGLDVVVYTGTHGLCQLEDIDGDMVDIHLYIADGTRLPVPRYASNRDTGYIVRVCRFYWKVVYDPVANQGVAVVGVNNIHLKELPSDYAICPGISNHPILDNVFYPNELARGAIWACR